MSKRQLSYHALVDFRFRGHQYYAGESFDADALEQSKIDMLRTGHRIGDGAAPQRLLDKLEKRSEQIAAERAAEAKRREQKDNPAPTIEEWCAAGYPADKYPPSGYTEVDSVGLTAYLETGEVPAELIAQAKKKRDDAENVEAAKRRKAAGNHGKEGRDSRKAAANRAAQ